MPTVVNVSRDALSTDGLFSKTNNMLFVIRPPQRRFKWTRKHVNDLWTDITNAYREDPDEPYFLGPLLLVPIDESNRLSVIDGQQRITTLSILLAVLRDRCREFEGLRHRAGVLQELICRLDYDGNPIGDLVITLQDQDNPTYINSVREYGSTQSTYSYENLLTRAVQTLADSVDEYLEEAPELDREESLRSLSGYILDRVKLFPLEVANESAAYLVFDTTNTRGLRLSPSEALKARLVTTAARKDSRLSEELIETWDRVAGRLEDVGLPIDAMKDYLHAIWCAKDGYTPKGSLDRIATKLTETEKLRDFVQEIERYCLDYLAVVHPSEHAWVTEDLKDLRNLNVQSYGFLTMVHHHVPGHFEEAVSLVLSLQVRNITLGPHQANRYERQWPTWAGLVLNGHFETAFRQIRNEMVSDEEFRQSFEEVQVKTSGVARHLLRRLDPISQPGSGVQPMDIEVEHILPKSVVTKLMNDKTLTRNVRNWIEHLDHKIPVDQGDKKEIGQELEQYLNRLGNQALLNDKANRGAKDKPFQTKKEFYEKQALELTNRLIGCEEWKPEQIIERQRKMAARAPETWPK